MSICVLLVRFDNKIGLVKERMISNKKMDERVIKKIISMSVPDKDNACYTKTNYEKSNTNLFYRINQGNLFCHSYFKRLYIESLERKAKQHIVILVTDFYFDFREYITDFCMSDLYVHTENMLKDVQSITQQNICNEISDTNETINVNASGDINETINVTASGDINKTINLNASGDINKTTNFCNNTNKYTNPRISNHLLFLNDVRMIIKSFCTSTVSKHNNFSFDEKFDDLFSDIDPTIHERVYSYMQESNKNTVVKTITSKDDNNQIERLDSSSEAKNKSFLYNNINNQQSNEHNKKTMSQTIKEPKINENAKAQINNENTCKTLIYVLKNA
ncbi:hypothetical protein BDAP_001729 [Binucleata daphniae]